MTFVCKQSLERLTQRRARHSMLAGDTAAGHGLSVGKRHQHDALDATETVPQSLVCVARLGKRNFDGRSRKVIGGASPIVEQVVEMVRQKH